MTHTPARRFLHALAGGPLDARPDAELLDRFARYGERPALEAVVRRHGPLVRGVCRRHLGTSPDADDAFQATFLVLLRHTGRGRPPAAVGPWLYAVAVRTSARLRSRRRLQPLPEAVPDRTPDPSMVADWVPVLDRELAGLPAKYRDALVACELQGRSRREAATQLGIAEGTLSSRLARGRELLRRRLLKHGTLLPAAGLATLTAGEAASAEAVAATLALADGAVPAAVAAAVPPAGWGLWKALAAGGLLGAVLAGGLAAGLGDGEPADPGRPARPAAEMAPAPRVVTDPAGPVVPDAEALQGVWLFEDFLLSEAGVERLAKGDQGGRALLEAEAAQQRGRPNLIVSGDRCWVDGDRRFVPFTLRLDPTRLPKWLDRTRGSGSADRRETVRGIYQLADDRLTVADGTATGSRRPAELGPSDDIERVSVTTYRKAPPPPADQLAAAKPLLGRWKLVRGQYRPADKPGLSEMSWGELEVTPYALFLYWQQTKPTHHNVQRAATFRLDPAKRHPWIDLTVLAEEAGGSGTLHRPCYGVYEVSGDTLRLAVGRDRAFRPLDFDLPPGAEPTDKNDPSPTFECFEFKRMAENRNPERE